MVRWIGIGLMGVVALLAVVVVSARLSLDSSREHSARTEALPLWSGGAGGDAGSEISLFRVAARGLEFRTRVAGVGNPGPAVLMLHGFPESSAMWQPLLEAAAAAGFRAAAFDQRGYSPGARFEDPSHYRLPELHQDVLAVADALGFERFHLVGHDWGSIVGWSVTAGAPDRVLTWTSLSIPHPAAVAQANGDRGTPLYIRFFRVPGLMETVFSFGGFALLDPMMAEVPPEQVAEYRAILSEPGGMTAAFDWYRAMDGLPKIDSVAQPVLYMFGNRDMPVFVGEAPRAAQEPLLLGPHRSIELDAGHWLIEERTDDVVGAILDHLEARRG